MFFEVFHLPRIFFSNMATTNTFHIDILITYSREQCNYIGWVLLWSSSECLRMIRKTDWWPSCQFLVLSWRISDLEIFWILKLSLMFYIWALLWWKGSCQAESKTNFLMLNFDPWNQQEFWSVSWACRKDGMMVM